MMSKAKTSPEGMHEGTPLATDVWLATRHLHHWNEEMGLDQVARVPEIDSQYIHRLAQLIRFVRLGRPRRVPKAQKGKRSSHHQSGESK